MAEHTEAEVRYGHRNTWPDHYGQHEVNGHVELIVVLRVSGYRTELAAQSRLREMEEAVAAFEMARQRVGPVLCEVVSGVTQP